MLAELISKHGLGANYEELFEKRQIIWGDFLKPGIEREERKYEEVGGR